MNTIEVLRSVINILDEQNKMLLAICVCIIAVSAVVAMVMIEVVSLEKRFNRALEIIDENFEAIKQDKRDMCQSFKTVVQCERETAQMIEDIVKAIEQHERNEEFEKLIKNAHSNAAKIAAEMIDGQAELTKERFRRLSKELSLEEFKEEAEEYFEEKIRETYDMVDSAWGDDLMKACEKQNRFKAKLEKVRKASSNNEAFEAMFAPI